MPESADNPDAAKARPVRVGVIADTHDRLDPQVLEVFAGVDHIIHGGDVCSLWLLSQLECVAPLSAALGNNDFGLDLRMIESVAVGGRNFLIQHILDPYKPDGTLRRRMERDKPAVVVFGHTHVPFCETIDGTLFLNPGSAGQSRRGVPRSVAILECSESGVETRMIRLG